MQRRFVISNHSGKHHRKFPIRGNPPQQEAIRHFRGPCEVIAGPGSGKTFVLVERILYLLLEQRVPPSQILVLTFSKAAALQMQSRFQKRIRELSLSADPPSPDSLSADSFTEVTFGTFHSVFLSILKASSVQRMSILDNSRSRKLLSSLFERYYGRLPQSEELTDLSALIAKAKASGEIPDQKRFQRLLEDYETYLKENSLLDFEDMIGRCLKLLRRNPELLSSWQKRYRYFLIDEFQDINREQFEGIQLLAGAAANLFVVGDDDQSIYRFRGADVRLIIDFPDYYPGTHVIHLNINYRSYAPIVRCGQQVICKNRMRLSKEAIAARQLPDPHAVSIVSSGPAFQSFLPDGVCVKLSSYETEKAEYLHLCEVFRKMTSEQRQSCAVIVRSHSQMQGLLRILEQEKISYRLQQGGPSGSGKNHKNSRLLQKAGGLLSLIRSYYTVSEELSRGTILRRDLFAVMNHPERFLLRSRFQKERYSTDELLSLCPRGSGEQKALWMLCRDLRTMERLSPVHSLRYLSRVIGIGEEEKKIWERLFVLSASYTGIPELRLMLERLSPEELWDTETEDSGGETDGVLVLTMHASKGLEFDTVYLPDLNEGIFPGRRAVSMEAIEEERRLFYVAITRARDRLHLMYLRGNRNNPRRPSRFLEPLGVKTWE